MALNDKDIQKLAAVFATKQELKEATSNLATKEDLNNVMKTLDWLVGKVQNLSDELKIGFGQYRRLDDQLRDHDKRIKTLETKVFAT